MQIDTMHMRELTAEEKQFFDREQEFHEKMYLAGTNPRQQSGFGLAHRRLPQWRDRIFIGNAYVWSAPFKFDFVRTEMVYVPSHLRQRYTMRLLQEVVAPGGYLIACSYGSSRPEGTRAEALIDEFRGWGLSVAGVHEVVSQEHGYVVTSVVSVRN